MVLIILIVYCELWSNGEVLYKRTTSGYLDTDDIQLEIGAGDYVGNVTMDVQQVK